MRSRTTVSILLILSALFLFIPSSNVYAPVHHSSITLRDTNTKVDTLTRHEAATRSASNGALTFVDNLVKKIGVNKFNAVALGLSQLVGLR